MPVIIDKEAFEIANRIHKYKKRTPKYENRDNKLSGLLYCSDCGKRTWYSVTTTKDKKYNKEYIDDSYKCSGYSSYTQIERCITYLQKT